MIIIITIINIIIITIIIIINVTRSFYLCYANVITVNKRLSMPDFYRLLSA